VLLAFGSRSTTAVEENAAARHAFDDGHLRLVKRIPQRWVRRHDASFAYTLLDGRMIELLLATPYLCRRPYVPGAPE